MLQDIRDNSQGLIAKIIVGVIIAVFALFGVQYFIWVFPCSALFSMELPPGHRLF